MSSTAVHKFAGFCTACAIITQAVADASGRIQDRMPAFAAEELRDDWLDPASVVDARGMLVELACSATQIARMITTYLVGRTVNNARTADATDPQLIAP